MNQAETRAEHINPCGYAGMRVTQVCELGITVPKETLNKSVRGECFPFAPFDTPRYARHSGRTGNVSNHINRLIQRFPINELQAELAQNLIHGLQRHFESKRHPE